MHKDLVSSIEKDTEKEANNTRYEIFSEGHKATFETLRGLAPQASLATCLFRLVHENSCNMFVLL